MQQLTDRVFRSFLFVPVLSHKYIDKAANSEADAIILDLEASIPLDRKTEARDNLGEAAAFLNAAGQIVLCRINAEDLEDVKAVADSGVAGAVVPLVEYPDQIAKVVEKLSSGGSQRLVFPIIETPLGLYNLRDILAVDVEVAGLMFGSEDFVLRMGSRALPCSETLFNAAWQVAFAARAHDIMPYGLAGSLADFKDMAAFEELCQEARKMGFGGCPAIHPAQVEVLHRVFTPSQEELDSAREAIEAFEKAGEKAVSVAGRMIDYPIYYRLKKLLDEYGAGRIRTQGHVVPDNQS